MHKVGKQDMDLNINVHTGLVSPGTDVAMVTADYDYYHYGCDGTDDRGWGCGYRTLQTLCSWVRRQQECKSSKSSPVPSIKDIQEALVSMEDKPGTFPGSKEWIGSVEVSLCVDYFYQVPCRIIHVTKGIELNKHLAQIAKHFREIGAPIMMGGDTDASSKGLVGVCLDSPAFLVLDPHYFGLQTSIADLQANDWAKWVPIDHFFEKSFYNLCLPQFKNKP